MKAFAFEEVAQIVMDVVGEDGILLKASSAHQHVLGRRRLEKRRIFALVGSEQTSGADTAVTAVFQSPVAAHAPVGSEHPRAHRASEPE